MNVEFFTAKWCSVCKGIKPHVSGACTDAKVEIEYIDADANANYCVSRNVTTLPTIIIYSGDIEVDRIIGSIGKYEMAKRLKEAKGSDA